MTVMTFLWSTASSCGGFSTRQGTFEVGLKEEHKNYQRAETPLL